jgi:hypothetical protein
MEDFAPLRLSAELVFCAVGFLLFVEAEEVRVLFGMGFLRTQSKSSLPLAVWSRNGLFIVSQQRHCFLPFILEWYKIRDTFFGRELSCDQNVPLVLELASSCEHPDARWLADGVCSGKDVRTVEDAQRVFSALGQNDARAQCFMHGYVVARSMIAGGFGSVALLS